jgi:hypothetical protein
MSYMHPAALEARRKYLTRHDAWRFAPPGTPEAKMPGWLDPSMTRVRFEEAQEEEARAAEAASQEEFERELQQLRASHERLKAELAEINYELAWRRMCRKYGYTPNQQVDRKWDGQPRDEGGRYDFGKKPKLVSQPAAMRRGPSDKRPPLPLHIPIREPSNSQRERITISNSAQTGMSQVDETTEKLRKILEDVVNKVPAGIGADYGRRVHLEFAKAVRAANIRGIGSDGVEQTFPTDVPYGADESVRTDATFRDDARDPAAIFDVKTGRARLRPARVRQLREKVGAGPNIPVIEMHVLYGLSLKGRANQSMPAWFIIIRIWHPFLPDIADLVEGGGVF